MQFGSAQRLRPWHCNTDLERAPISLRGPFSVRIDWIAELSKPRRYDRQFDRLRGKYSGQRRLHTLTHGGVSFAELLFDQKRLVSLLAREVKVATYKFSPARVREVMLDRPRDLFSLPALD